MSRDSILYLKDIREACRRVESYVAGMSREDFLADPRTYDAVVRNLQIIGDAAKRVPDSIREMMPEIPFRQIAEMRNILVHAYFGIDDDILWDVVANHVGKLKIAVEGFLASEQA